MAERSKTTRNESLDENCQSVTVLAKIDVAFFQRIAGCCISPSADGLNPTRDEKATARARPQTHSSISLFGKRRVTGALLASTTSLLTANDFRVTLLRPLPLVCWDSLGLFRSTLLRRLPESSHLKAIS